MTLQQLLMSMMQFYQTLIFAYVILSWFPVGGVVDDIRRVLATICEPYLGIFRRIIPPIGMIDISPIVAILALQMIGSLLVRL